MRSTSLLAILLLVPRSGRRSPASSGPGNFWWVLALTSFVMFAPARATPDALDRKLILESRAEAADLWRQGWTVTDTTLVRRLEAIVDGLTAGRAHDSSIVLRVHVFRNPVANAFCLPDGSIYLFVGLLAQMSDWDEVSFVLAHEAEHALSWHGQRNRDQARTKTNLFGLLSRATGTANLAAMLGQLGLALTEGAMISGYGRTLEAEADAAAVAAMQRQGLSACAGVSSLRALLVDGEEESSAGNFFWGDHPLVRNRIAAISTAVPGGCPPNAPVVATEYAAVRDSMTRFSARLWLDSDNVPEALRQVQRCLARDSSVAGDHAMQGEIMLRIAISRPLRDTMGRADTLALAEHALHRALELDPASAAPWRWLGAVAEARGDKPAAIDYLEKYLGGGPSVPSRRAVKRRLEELRASGAAQPAPAVVDSVGAPTGAPPDSFK